MSGRCLRRPYGGWGARAWRREVLGWLNLAFLFLCCWATGNTMLAMIEFIAKSGGAQ